jgi:hypothetical protein
MAQIAITGLVSYLAYFPYNSGKFPWPLANRDYVCHRKSRSHPDRGIHFTMSKSGKHESKPEQKGFVRVEDYFSKSVMKHIDDETTELRLLYFDDMKGSIPKSLVNW